MVHRGLTSFALLLTTVLLWQCIILLLLQVWAELLVLLAEGAMWI
jgi:hypothetical protein